MGLIYLDACLLIYAIERDPEFSPKVVEAFRRDGANRYAISPLVRMECMVKPIRVADQALQRQYARAFDRFIELDMPSAVFDAAARLRAGFGLRTPDALHLACAVHHGCEALWTNDERFARAAPIHVRNVLS